MRRFFYFLSIFALGALSFSLNIVTNTSATTDTAVYVNLTTLEASENQVNYTSIPEYKTLDEFLAAKNSNSLAKVYVTDFLYDGVGAVKSPDLDDFIENQSNDTKVKNLEIKVINVNTMGRIEFSGTINGAMIGVDTNDKTENIDLVLNNVDLDTDSKKAPAVFVYNKDRNYADCKVTIKTAAGTKNYLEGGKLKKVSLLDSTNLSQYQKYYSGENLTNYNSYSKYYGIYTKAEIEQVLFATVTADNEDLSEGDPLYFYKGSGAISSDIDLYFEGEGFLEVVSKNKEGIETKGNLTFAGGSGDYAVYAQDDCLNTTTANSTAGTVRNALTINVNSLLAVVSDEGDEGDAIDSNGTLTITGGTIYAFAHSDSQDSGIDSETGTTIENATVVATGNMADAVSGSSAKIYAQFNQKIAAGTLIVAKDEKDDILVAFETDKDITTFLYADPNLEFSSYRLYGGGEIVGEQTNGLYTKILSYSGGTELSYRDVGDQQTGNFDARTTNRSSVILTIWLGEIAVLGLVVFGLWLEQYLKNRKK